MCYRTSDTTGSVVSLLTPRWYSQPPLGQSGQYMPRVEACSAYTTNDVAELLLLFGSTTFEIEVY